MKRYFFSIKEDAKKNAKAGFFIYAPRDAGKYPKGLNAAFDNHHIITPEGAGKRPKGTAQDGPAEQNLPDSPQTDPALSSGNRPPCLIKPIPDIPVSSSGHFSPCCRYEQKCGLPRLYPSFFPIRKRKTVPTSQIKPVNSRRRRFRQHTNDLDKLRPFRPARFPEYLSHSRIFCSARQQKRLRPLPSPNIGRHITPFGNIHKLWYFFGGGYHDVSVKKPPAFIQTIAKPSLRQRCFLCTKLKHKTSFSLTRKKPRQNTGALC